jgi:hypothetical protein
VTSTFQGDSKGVWNTREGFNQSLSIYGIQFTGTQIDNRTFESLFETFSESMYQLSQRALYRDYAWTLIVFSSFSIIDHQYNIKFFPNGKANVIFNQPITAISFGNKLGVCNQTQFSATYDATSGVVTLTVPLPTEYDPGAAIYPYYQPNNVCEQFSTWDFKYYQNEKKYQYSFDIIINMISFTTAMAVNFNMIDPVKNLSPAYLTYQQMDDDALYSDFLEQYGSFYIDPYFPNMDPIFCLNANYTKGKSVCFLYDSATFFYPIIATWNYDTSDQTSCQPECYKPIDQRYPSCQTFDQMVGLIFFPVAGSRGTPLADYTASTKQLFEFGLFMQAKNDSGIVDFSYPALESTILGSSAYQDYDNDFYSLYTELCGGNCSMLALEFWSSDVTNTPFLNDYSVEINTLATVTAELRPDHKNYTLISCENNFYFPTALEYFGDIPPVTLVQSYYTCVVTLKSAIERAIGNSAATAAFYSGIIFIVLLTSAVYYFNNFTAKYKKILTFDEKIKERESNAERKIAELQSELDDVKEKLNLMFFKLYGSGEMDMHRTVSKG